MRFINNNTQSAESRCNLIVISESKATKNEVILIRTNYEYLLSLGTFAARKSVFTFLENNNIDNIKWDILNARMIPTRPRGKE